MASDCPSGGPTTYADIRRAFDLSMVDDGVESTVLDLHSCGGDAMGAFDLADHIYQMRGVKPITAIVNEEAYSAAYLLASACDRIVLTRTAGVGSIGVIATHADLSRAEDAAGITITHVYSGARKADFSPHSPLTSEALQRLQESVDQTRELFVQTVARNLGMDPKDIRATEAGTYTGKAAVTAGLAHEVAPADKAMQKAAAMRRKKITSASATGGKAEIPQGGKQMTKAELQELNPALYAEIVDEGKALGKQEARAQMPDTSAALAAAREEGAALERARIQGVEAQCIPGHEALIATLKYDGKTSPGDAALQVLGADKQLRAGALEQLAQQANPPVVAVETPAGELSAPAGDAPIEERAAHEWEKDSSLKGEFTSQEAYVAYRRKQECGRVRILGKT
jgi:signal peptide peptidase SppA